MKTEQFCFFPLKAETQGFLYMLIEEDGVKTNSVVGLQSQNKKTYFKIRPGTNKLNDTLSLQ